ncbi:hypothetical protein [Natronosalvus rutilus]|uniref:DUF8135 domain-containing protein n=1 Tax=Natronosalvus rutilus TaxID=2953753 RepID=A0A9E7N5Y1_9EURY|nr:hypothetical protein [Natronosalvus rutilus]UTF52155.1 hypothetical protein NGM29_10105 [Natronosalvus rutilus]
MTDDGNDGDETSPESENSDSRPDQNSEPDEDSRAVAFDERALESDTTDEEPPALESASQEPDDRTDPLGDLAARVSDQATSPPKRDPAVDDLFDREDVAEIDRERLWAELEDESSEVSPEPSTEREYRTVPKRSYCHQCEYFSDPPAVACNHEGTEILEMPSMETYRVVECPVVLEDEALEGDR